MGAKNEKGIWLYGEDDAATATTFSELLNLGQQSVSDRINYFAGTTAERLALDPAPAGALWRDTNNGERLYSADPTGEWRRHEGSVVVAAGALAAVGSIYGRSVSVDLPTVIAAHETIMITATELGGSTYSWIAQNLVNRAADKTTIGIRHMSIIATAQGFTFAWRVVGGAA